MNWHVVEFDAYHETYTEECVCVSPYEDDSADAICFLNGAYEPSLRLQYAKIIAAAPDLLAACEWLLKPDHAIGSLPELVRKAEDRARAAVNKARGLG